ncbi:glycosyl hydrolase, partial [Pseudoxanthomonas sp. SGD-10]
MDNKIKPIALYLPQYHEIEENNQWWGKGFTEWTNVKKAKALFEGHYQPHVPLNQHYYDLTNINELVNQASLARDYGIYGFCFYHYWFNGKLLLETPLHNMLESGKPDFPFCLCWANENWTRTWDGQEKEVLMKQEYSLEDDKAHIKYLIPFFKDSRYIKIGNKPVFLMYRTELHPDIKSATVIWREEVKKAGFDDLFLIRIENFKKDINPDTYGFDAGMEFAPDTAYQGKKVAKKNMVSYIFKKILHNLNLKKSAHYQHGIWSYETLMNNMINKPPFDYKYFRCVCPS